VTEGPNGTAFEVPGYRLRRRIGRGGFAVVYEAEQLSLGRAVAVKMLTPETATERDLRRFDRERLLLSELSRHRHVVDVIDAGTTVDGQPFIVMRLYRRGSLAQALTDSGPLRSADVVSIVGKLAGALQAAHNLGVVHRDVKPENVLVADDGEPALADFGISVLTGPDRTTTSNFFSIGHAAPEVLSRDEYGVASDVYSLASTAYQLLAGRCPFDGASQFAQMRAIVEDPVPPIGRSDVPPGVEAVVRRGLAKDPRDRYPSVMAFAEALDVAWRAAQPAGPVSPVGPVSALPGYPPARSGTRQEHGGQPSDDVPAPAFDPASAFDPAPAFDPASAFDPARARAGVEGRYTPGDPVLAASPRRSRRVRVAAAAVAVGVPAVLGATYALDVPPGSMLRPQVDPAVPGVVLASDMSRQGYPEGDNPTNLALELYLETINSTAGRYRVTLRPYDVATPRYIRWDESACRTVAKQHLARPEEVGVIGPYNTGCAQIMMPILDAASDGPLVMISNGATHPGLTKTWDVGEPGKYYPSGKRHFARVVTTDDVQAEAAATFAHGDLLVTKVFVLDDGGFYGKNVARGFADAARQAGIDVVGQTRWNRSDKDYRDLFAKVKSSGADAVFLGGAVANNGLQLVKDKVAVLGDNTAVKLLAPDGFTGDAKLPALAEADGMYLTFPGLSPGSIRLRGGAGSDFLNRYQKKYGKDPDDPFAIYAVAAAQILVEAIENSDGTRAGVQRALFSGPGITVPAAESVLGRDTWIDPTSGDVSIQDVTIEVIKQGTETTEKIVPLPRQVSAAGRGGATATR
jgi:branched-chain amino acid transport system substrate-binding protein